MNVLHVIPALFDDHDRVGGGAERYALELARHMGERVPTRLLTFGSRDRIIHRWGLPIRILGGAHYLNGHPFDPVHPAMLAEFAAADVIHCHQHVGASRIAAAFGRLRGQRVFCTDHGGGAWDITARLRLQRLFSAHLHVSEFSRRISELGGRHEVILGGVDLDRFHPGEAPAAEPGARRVLFVGRLLPHKGVDYLLEGLPGDLGLDVAGPALDTDFLAELRVLAEGKDVHFHHDWDDDRLIDAYRQALCVVLPSVHHDRYGNYTAVPELLGQTLLEGMACGRPAIATSVGGMPEVVRDGETGFVVPPNDPVALGERLTGLRDSPSEGSRLGAQARSWVEAEFVWPRVVDRCLAAYRG
jgi:alpha-maltose-1-phosphate synthase